MKDLLEWYSSLGWELVPVYGIDPVTNLCQCRKKGKCDRPGKHPIPRDGLKAASADLRKNRAIQKKHNPNWAVVTGEGSGIWVLDIDVKDDGFESLEEMVNEHGPLPETLQAHTGGGGRHIIFRWPGSNVKNAVGIYPGIDVRGTNGYIVIEPSTHASGGEYKWEDTTAEIVEAPAWLLEKATSKTRRITKKAESGIIAMGERNQRLTSEAGKYRRQGLEADAILEKLRHTNQTKCEEPVEDSELEQITDSVCGSYDASNDIEMMTDTGNANRFRLYTGGNLLYTDDGQWASFNGQGCWDLQDRTPIEQIESMIEHLCSTQESDESDAYRKFIMQIGNHSRMQAMLKIAQAKMRVRRDSFDSRPFEITCANGILDLVSGELREAKNRDRVLIQAPTSYDPSAKCPRWLQFLDEIMLGDQDMVSYLQRTVGYSLTASIREQCFFLLYGTGANGKSTFLNVLRGILGGYVREAPSDAFIKKRFKDDARELVNLVGRRIVTASEPDFGDRLDEQVIKKVTGGEELEGRFLYKDAFSYSPVMKIWMATNHYLGIQSQKAIWRRVRLIPFEAAFAPEQQDRELTSKLLEEAEGVLAWAVAGCHEWLRDGLQAPAKVEAETVQYKETVDVIGTFLEEATEKGDGVLLGELYHRYRTWCEDNGERPLSNIKMCVQLINHGIHKVRRSKGMFMEGIQVKQQRGSEGDAF